MGKRPESIEIRETRSGKGFLELKKVSVTHVYGGGARSRPYTHEVLFRKGLDSVAVALYFEREGRFFVALRRQLRTAKAARALRGKPVEARYGECLLLEAVAGSLEPGEDSPAKRKDRAIAEIFEEAGFRVARRAVVPLGKPFFPSPGQSTEKVFPFAARIAPEESLSPPGDGSLCEKDSGGVVFLPLTPELLERIEDAKTEICLSRLMRLLDGGRGAKLK